MAFTLRTDKELENALTRLSKELGTSRQEVVRQAVLSMDDQVKRNAKFNAALEETLETWSELIERLANT